MAVSNHLACDHGSNQEHSKRRSDRQLGPDLQISKETQHRCVSPETSCQVVVGRLDVDRPYREATGESSSFWLTRPLAQIRISYAN